MCLILRFCFVFVFVFNSTFHQGEEGGIETSISTRSIVNVPSVSIYNNCTNCSVGGSGPKKVIHAPLLINLRPLNDKKGGCF